MRIAPAIELSPEQRAALEQWARGKLFYREVVQSYREAARDILRKAWSDDGGQDIAEYAVMLAVILVLVVGTIRLVGSNANTAFSQAASSIQ
jgi:Flp pilus assembly pilin Flp